MRNHSRVWAGALGAWLLLGGAAGATAGPAPEDPAAETSPAAADEAPEVTDTTVGTEQPAPAPPASNLSVPSIRRDMETNMSSLGDLASDAKRDSDLVRAACVLDKQERAQGVMELATGALLVIRDEGSSAESRGFAVEKLAAASDRLDGLVEQARECAGDKTPERSDDETRNELDEEPTIPIPDPTMGGGAGGGKPPGLPPPVDDGMPPSVGSPSL